MTTPRIIQAVGGDYWLVLGEDTPDGPRVIARGELAMCQLVAAGKPLFIEPGELFE